jgi:pyrroloquinoline quinone biosynthesis protein B
VLLIDAQIDHVTGLLMLRERSTPLPVYATPEVFADLSTGFPVTQLLSHFCGVDARVLGAEAFYPPGLAHTRVVAHPIASKAPPYSPHRHDPHPGDNIALSLTNTVTGQSLFYAPGLGDLDERTFAAMQAADVLLVDGTFWTRDELIGLGFSKKPAEEMGHLPQSGAGGMIEVLDRLSGKRKILIHINNTNPILNEDSPERALLGQHGIEVAFDGMEINL